MANQLDSVNKVRLFSIANKANALATMLGTYERMEFSGSAAKGLSTMLKEMAESCESIINAIVDEETEPHKAEENN